MLALKSPFKVLLKFVQLKLDVALEILCAQGLRKKKEQKELVVKVSFKVPNNMKFHLLPFVSNNYI